MRSLFPNPHPAVLALGFLLSPESLTKLGNGVGQGGRTFIALLALAALAQIVNGWSYDRLQQVLPGQAVETQPLRSFSGHRVSALLPFATRFPAFVCFGTAVLATAGFVFNEVFVYWFPNFAFAYLLLGFCLLVNLTSPRAGLVLQMVCVGVSVAGLLALCLASVFVGGAPAPAATAGRVTFDLGWPSLCVSLFLGFELSVYAPQFGTEGPKTIPTSRFAVALAALLFLLWAGVSLRAAPLDKLVESTLPHMLTSRIILGETGRVIMGAVVLAGCCGVVNGSFLAVRTLAEIGIGRLPAYTGSPKAAFGGRAGIVILGVAVAGFLAGGLAGEPQLDVWLRGSFLLWLLGYILFQATLWIPRPREPLAQRGQAGIFGDRRWIHALPALVFLVLAAVSIAGDPDKIALAGFLVVAPPASGLILLPWYRVLAGGAR